MTHTKGILSRRAAGMLIAGVMAWPQQCFAMPSTQTPLQTALLSLFENPAHAVVVGEACLKGFSRDALALDTFANTILAARQDGSMPQDALSSRLKTMIGDDFAKGVIVNIDGWQLSFTEAQLYALVAVNFPPTA